MGVNEPFVRAPRPRVRISLTILAETDRPDLADGEDFPDDVRLALRPVLGHVADVEVQSVHEVPR